MKKSTRNIIIGLLIVIALIMVLSLSTFNSIKSNVETKSLYAQGLEVVQLMSEMTQNEEYVDIHTGNSEIKTVIQNISKWCVRNVRWIYLRFC